MLLVVACLGPCGCQGAGAYWANRGRDVGDVFDFKGGWALGVGAKAEITSFFGVGAGAGRWFQHYEKFGRKILSTTGGLFFHLAVYGNDGVDGPYDPGYRDENYILGFNRYWLYGLHGPAKVNDARVGAEVLLPGVTGGLYLNFGQLADLLVGFFGFDPAGDDSKASSVDEPVPASGAEPDARAP